MGSLVDHLVSLGSVAGNWRQCGHKVVVENNTQKLRKMKGTRCVGYVPLNFGHWWPGVLFQPSNIYQLSLLGLSVSVFFVNSKHITKLAPRAQDS